MGTQTYTVVGTWPFPLDMLRHDGSMAASPEDQQKIDALSGEFSPDRKSLRVSTSIVLMMTDVGNQRPNTRRWESFGWSVPGDEAREHEKRLDREDQAKANLRRSALSKLTPAEIAALDLDKGRP